MISSSVQARVCSMLWLSCLCIVVFLNFLSLFLTVFFCLFNIGKLCPLKTCGMRELFLHFFYSRIFVLVCHCMLLMLTQLSLVTEWLFTQTQLYSYPRSDYNLVHLQPTYITVHTIGQEAASHYQDSEGVGEGGHCSPTGLFGDCRLGDFV